MRADGESTAFLCITVIGVGYLFPISAIWAAFDYWKVLFPDDNIEFSVTGVYQVGSVVTVALLSVVPSMKLGPRILGGFCGQFVCLSIILGFRWLALPPTELFDLLIGVVLLCSVATGYLDSAMLALCSQYSPKMQQYLQIGIGMGTLVSVLYRDATKLLLAGNVADATTAYFFVALCTVLICIFSYRLLMSLPVSRHLREDGSNLNAQLLDLHAPPKSPPAFFTATCTPNGLEASSRKSLNGVCAASASDADFKTVWGHVWTNQLVIFINLFLTTLCYPGVITSIPCRQMEALADEHWFQTLLLTAFTLADIIARFLTHLRCGMDYSTIGWTILVRMVVFPCVLYCATSAEASDLLAFCMVAAFGFLNGYCVSLSLIVINEIPGLSDEQRKTCGRISACSVNSGLCLGSLAAAGLAAGFSIGDA